jgi:hypothetical protein
LPDRLETCPTGWFICLHATFLDAGGKRLKTGRWRVPADPISRGALAPESLRFSLDSLLVLIALVATYLGGRYQRQLQQPDCVLDRHVKITARDLTADRI